MKKLSLFMVFAMLITAFAAITVSAHFDGMKEPEYYTIPEVNTANPAIKVDGVMDFDNGEWNGALKYVMDYTVSDDNARLYDFTIWSPEVWITDGSAFSLGSPEELPANWQPVIDNYLLWDGDGIYIATTYKTKLHADVTNAERNSAFFDYYMTSTTDTYAYGLPSNIQHMILPTDDFTAYVGTEGKWFYAFTTDDKTESWFENYTMYSSASDSELVADVHAVGYQTPEADADGNYTVTYEMFIPWAFLNLDNVENATTTMFDFYGDKGITIQIGFITRLRNTPDASDIDSLPYIQFTDSAGWKNYNFYTLGDKAADYSGTADFLIADVNNQNIPEEEEPAETEAPAETAAPETEAETTVVETTETPASETTAAADITEAPAADTTAPESTETASGSYMVWIIIIIAIVVIAAVVAVVVINKKKKA